jgi:hypothetical protein
MTIVSPTSKQENVQGDFVSPRRKKRSAVKPVRSVYGSVCASKTAIPSYGLILFWYDEEEKDIYYLIIQRRDTFEYIDFLRGNYYGKIPDMIGNMATFEKELLLAYPCSDLRQDMQASIFGPGPVRPLKSISRKKIVYHQKEFLTSVLTKATGVGSDPEFEFPKGRKSKVEPETDLECAVREFREETQVCSDLHLLPGIAPLTETYRGTDSKSYYTKFFVARCFEKKPTPARTSMETLVRKIELVSDEVDNVYWYRCKDTAGKLCDRRYLMLRSLDTHLKNNMSDIECVKI